MEEIDDRPFTEKYRPKTLSEVVGHEKIIKSLQVYVKQKSFPHMLFAGPAGTGKTSTAYAFTKDLMGGHIPQGSFLELNASDENSLEDMQKIVKTFASQQSVLASDFKIILLDEADNLSRDAQPALRRIMESGNVRTRFILLCNYQNDIIPPIISRCSVFCFPRLNETFVISKLKQIAELEQIKLPDEIFSQIFQVTWGDMRQAVTLLQVIADYQKEGLLVGDPLFEFAGFLPPSFLKTFIEALHSKSFTEVKDIFMQQLGGKNSRNVLQQLLNLVSKLKLPNPSLATLIDEISGTDYYLTEGATEQVQFAGLIARLSEFFKS